MERLFSTRASGLEVICFGSVMACGAGRVWDVARTVIVIVITTTITNRLRMRMVASSGSSEQGKSISVDASGTPGVPARPFRTGRATPVAPLAKATGHYSRSVVMLGRAFVLLEGIAAVDDQQLSGDVGGRF